MTPGTWSCDDRLGVRFLQAPLHLAGVALALLAWSFAAALHRPKAADLAWRLFVSFAAGCLARVVFTAVSVGVAVAFDANPTPAIKGVENVGVVAGWATLVAVVVQYLRGSGRVSEASGPSGSMRWQVASKSLALAYKGTLGCFAATALAVLAGAAIVAASKSLTLGLAGGVVVGIASILIFIARGLGSSGTRAKGLQGLRRPLPLLAGVLAVLALAYAVSGPLFASSHRPILSLTTSMASDDCLAVRVIGDTRRPLLSDLEHRTSAESGGVHSELFLPTGPPNIAQGAERELTERGSSAAPGIARVLSRVLDDEDADVQRRATWLLDRLARTGGSDTTVRAWAESAATPELRTHAEALLACIARNRRNLISSRADPDCLTTSERAETKKREQEEHWKRWLNRGGTELDAGASDAGTP